MKGLIIFDFDGVIVESMPFSFSINKKDVPDLEYSEWQSWFEGNVYDEIREDLSNDNYHDSFYKKYSVGIVNILPIEGISEVIKELSKEHNLVIISSSDQSAIENYLKKYNLKKYFGEVLGRETHKSKVQKFNIILDKYRVKPAETLMITDTIGDIKEAREVGIRSLAVIWGVHCESKLLSTNPHFIARKPAEIINGVKDLLSS